MVPEPSKNVTATPGPTSSIPPTGGQITPTPSPAPSGRPADGQGGRPHVLPPVTGVVAPQTGEAMIREVRPTVVEGSAALATLAEGMMRTLVLAPLAWLLLAPLWARKLMPFLPKCYTLTNQRLMIRRGLKPRPVQSIPLAEIDEVRFDPGSYNRFYASGTLEIVSRGQVQMRLTGVPAPEAFRQTIISAVGAWVPGKSKTFQPFIAASAAK